MLQEKEEEQVEEIYRLANLPLICVRYGGSLCGRAIDSVQSTVGESAIRAGIKNDKFGGNAFIVIPNSIQKAPLVNIAHLLLSLYVSRSQNFHPRAFVEARFFFSLRAIEPEDAPNRSKNRFVCLFACLACRNQTKAEEQKNLSIKMFRNHKSSVLHSTTKAQGYERTFSQLFIQAQRSKVSAIFHLCSLCSRLYAFIILCSVIVSSSAHSSLCFLHVLCTRNFPVKQMKNR